MHTNSYIPVFVLLAFAGWTLLILVASIGVYRWSLILAGRASIAQWRADVPQGADWYQRAMRAHLNCVENLPVYAAIVVAMLALGAHGPLIDKLAVTMLTARIGQSTVHIALPLTNAATSVRFSLFTVQVICMIAMGLIATTASLDIPVAYR